MRPGLVAGLVMLLAVPAQAAPPPAWKTNCLMCHGADGRGQPGLYPRLEGRMAAVAASPEGRAWLISVLLFGQAGRILVDGKPLSGVMTPYAHLKDAELAAILTHSVALGASARPKPFTADEVKAARALPRRTATEVRQERERLAGLGLIP